MESSTAEKGFIVKFKPIGGATWILQIDDLKIACDPILLPKGTVHDFKWFKSKRLEEPIYEEADFEDVDIWLLTHNHEDHLDEEGLKRIRKECLVIIRHNLKRRLAGLNPIVLKHRRVKTYTLRGFKIEIISVPAVHGVVPVVAHLAGKVNGYWLTISKGENNLQLYVSGDTVYKRKIANWLTGRKADIYIPNVGGACKGTVIGTLTMTAEMMMKYLSIVNPEITLPVHFGTFSHYYEPVSAIEQLDHPSIKIIKAGDVYQTHFPGSKY